jgi:wyosine [tRNA(Phe)-imidazoG37] synthetase (radical SAM superfamily)
VSSPAEVRGWPAEQEILEGIEMRLRRLSEQDLKLNSITFSGYGEPTLYPLLREIVLGVKSLRDRYYPGVVVDILTNSSNIRHESTFQALAEFDSVVAKLDAGSQEVFQAINRPAGHVFLLEDIVRDLVRLRRATDRVTIQTLLFRSSDADRLDNFSADEIRLIADKVRLIDPKEVQIYTVERQPAESHVKGVQTSLLQEATERINDFVGKECARIYS